jgi:hypothetical protein
VSEFTQPTAPQDASAAASAGEVEEIDALPVLAGETHALRVHSAPDSLPGAWRATGAVIPAVQAAAVAAGGFVAGAAVVGLVHRRQRRSSLIGGARRGGGAIKSRAPHAPRLGGAGKTGSAVELVQIVGSRSLLVDVHLLRSAGDH